MTPYSLLIYFGGRYILKANQTKKWTATSIVILDKGVEREREPAQFGALYKYYPFITYEYEVLGTKYQSKKIYFDARACFDYEESAAKKYLSDLSLLEVAYVNPNDPSESILIQGIPKGKIVRSLSMIFFGFFILFLGGGIMFMD